MTVAQVPPHNLDAEIAVLGSVLLDNEALTEQRVSTLTPEHFYASAHQKIWTAFERMRSPTQPGGPCPIDLVTLSEELQRQGHLADVGGMSFLVGLGEGTPTAAYAEHYARIVEEKAHLRNLLQHSQQVMRLCYEQDRSLEDISDFAATGPELTTHQTPVVRVGAVLDTVIEQARHGSGPQGALTGLCGLDQAIGGLEPGCLYVLAARPSVGKTALAFQISANVARTHGRALYFSIEMPPEEVSARLVCNEARVDLGRFTNARRASADGTSVLGPRDWQRLEDAQARIQSWPLDVLEQRDLRLQTMVDEVRRAHREAPLSLFVIDYLQQVQVTGRAGENPTQRVTLISSALKALAMELKIPVLALSQLSRAVEQRPNKRPILSDLRESGSVEQDADVVLFIYRDEMYNPDTDAQGIAELIIGKQRNGPISTVKTQYHGPHTRFSDLA